MGGWFVGVLTSIACPCPYPCPIHPSIRRTNVGGGLGLDGPQALGQEAEARGGRRGGQAGAAGQPRRVGLQAQEPGAVGLRGGASHLSTHTHVFRDPKPTTPHVTITTGVRRLQRAQLRDGGRHALRAPAAALLLRVRLLGPARLRALRDALLLPQVPGDAQGPYASVVCRWGVACLGRPTD